MKDEPQYCGQKPNQGRLVPRDPNEEGYAVLKCGGTEVVLSYTVLHQMTGHLAVGAVGDPNVRDSGAVQKAIHAVVCEASLGHKG